MSTTEGGPDLDVRAAAPSDLDALAALHVRARAHHFRGRLPDALLDAPAERARWRASWAAALAGPDTTVLCGERSGVPVGVASYRPAPGPPAAVVLDEFHVDPDHWRSGVGTALHHACVTAWRAAGLTTARLQVHWYNRGARDFYARHGWRPDGARRAAPDATHLSLLLRLAPGVR